MKKLLILSLASCLAASQTPEATQPTQSFGARTKDAVQAPFVAAKKVLDENEITDDALNVLGQIKDFPGQTYESIKETAQEAKDSALAQKINEMGQKVASFTKETATTVKDSTVKATTSVKDGAVKAGTRIKEGVSTLASKTKEAIQSEAVKDALDDAKEVGATLFVDAPKEVAEGITDLSKAFWAKVVAVAKSVKAQFAE